LVNTDTVTAGDRIQVVAYQASPWRYEEEGETPAGGATTWSGNFITFDSFDDKIIDTAG